MNKLHFFCIFLFPIFLHAQTLGDLKEKARKNNPQQEVLLLIAQATTQQKKILQANFLPQTQFSAQGTWQSQVTEVPIKIPSLQITPVPKDQYRATVDVVQNIWDGGFTKNQIKLAEENGQTEQQKLEVDLQTLDEQISTLYFGAILSDKQKAISELLLDDLSNKIEKTKESIKNGVSIKINLLQLQAKKLELLQQLEEIKNRKKSAIESINLLTGENLNEDVVFSYNSTDSLTNDYNSRKELMWFDSQKNILDISSHILKSKNRPKLSVFATGGYGRPGINMLSTSFETYFLGGLQLKIPITHLYSSGFSAEKQQININQLKLEKQKESFLIQTDLKKIALKNEIERLKKQLVSDNEIRKIREEIRKTSEAQVENGIVSTMEYITNLTNEEIARQNVLIHQVQLLQTLENLKMVLGQK